MTKSLFFGLLLCSLIFFSCKKDKNKDKDKDKQNEQDLVARKLNAPELETLSTICQALRVKRKYFETLSHGSPRGTFEFAPSGRECQESPVEYANLTVNFDPDSYQFIPTINFSKFLKKVVTDENGPLKDFCYEVLDRDNGDSLFNLVKDGDVQYVYKFLKGNKIAFEVKTYLLRDQQWKKLSIDYYQVFLNSNSLKHGMIIDRIQNTYCRDFSRRVLQQKLL